MTPSDLVTLALLDPDQGVCPMGHRCRLSDVTGERVCRDGEYRGHALICWDITLDDIDRAEAAGASASVVNWARLSCNERQGNGSSS
jgi:hypothetical protein